MGTNQVLQHVALHKFIDAIVGKAGADLSLGPPIAQVTVIDGFDRQNLASRSRPDRIGYRTHVYFRTRSEAEDQRQFRCAAFAHHYKIMAQLHAWLINRFSHHEAYASWAVHFGERVQHEATLA